MTTLRLDTSLKIAPWFNDHCFTGRPVLPAVESMALLSSTLLNHFPSCQITAMTRARFPRFLEIAPGPSPLAVTVELREITEGLIQATLYSKKKTSKFSRLVEHASLCFGEKDQIPPLAAPDIIPDKPPFTVSGATIYRELIPFGPAYRNLLGVDLFPDTALAQLRTPDFPVACHKLGSPFLLDSAMHAACTWGQRFAGFVPFPVAFASRFICKASLPGHVYQATVKPIRIKKDLLSVNIDITEKNGEIIEQVTELEMRDVSGGTLRPAQWIVQETG